MNQPTDLTLPEALHDVRTVHDRLRDALPILVDLAEDGSEWPDSLLGDVAVMYMSCQGAVLWSADRAAGRPEVVTVTLALGYQRQGNRL